MKSTVKTMNMPPFKPVHKWYSWFLREMKKRYGEHWSNKANLTEEDNESLLKIHQAATAELEVIRMKRKAK